MQKLNHSLLPRIKVNRNYPVAMVTAPSVVGGLNLSSLEVEQAIKAKDLFTSLYSSSTLAKFLLRDSLELL